MYSQPYSLVGETLDNRVLDSYREGFADATELTVDSADEMLSTFEAYHFTPTIVTEKFTLLTETANQLSDVYNSMYKYAYANPSKVTVTRQSVSEYMSWNSTRDYLTEVCRRLLCIAQNADQYDIPNNTLYKRLELLGRNLFVYTNITRTSLLTEVTFNTDSQESFVFVEVPQDLHASMYPLWFIASSLGVLPSLQRPLDPHTYEVPESLPDAFYELTQPQTEVLEDGATYYNRFTNIIQTRTLQTSYDDPLKYYESPSNHRMDSYAEQLVLTYNQSVLEEKPLQQEALAAD